MNLRTKRGTWILGSCLLASVVATGALVQTRAEAPVAPPLTPSLAATVPLEAATSRLSYAGIVEPVLPAVVSVHSSRLVNSGTSGMEGLPPSLRQFFGDSFPGLDSPAPRAERGQGSGIIVDPDGYILTNAHVIEGADTLRVRLNDGGDHAAELIGEDPQTDLALLKIPATNLPVVPFGNSSSVRIGDVVFAIGNPFGVGQTVTMGIVSATGRGNLGIEDYEDFIQTDAAINPGNSGGALLDSNGALIGINTAIVGSGGSDGIGFAIPADMARHVMDELRQFGKVTRGRIGVVVQDVTPQLAQAMDLADTNGALVSDVASGSGAEAAGIRRGDVITAIDGTRVVDSRQLRLEVGELRPGTAVSLSILRDGSPRTLSVRLGDTGDSGSAPAAIPAEDSGNWGLELEELSPRVRQDLGLDASVRGIAVRSVAPNSVAESAGIRPGDVIVEINSQSVSSLRGALSLLDHDEVLLLLSRGGTTVFAALEQAA